MRSSAGGGGNHYRKPHSYNKLLNASSSVGGPQGERLIAVGLFQYVGAVGALFLAVAVIAGIVRQRTTKRFQKNVLLLAIFLLVTAVFSNALITLVVLPSVPSADVASTLVLAKRIQASLDFLFAIVIGVFIMATTSAQITSARDLRQHMIREFPDVFSFYVFTMVAGLVTVATVTPTSVIFPQWPETSPVIITFPDYFYLIVGLGNFTQLAFTPYKLLTYLHKQSPGRLVVRNTYLIILGVDGYGVSEMLFEVVLPLFGYDLRGPGFLIEVVLLALVAISIREKQFLHDLIVPAAEAQLETEPTYNPPRGFTYLVPGDDSDHAFEIFRDQVTHGAPGLCITRRPPRGVMARYGLEKTPVLWLSRVTNQRNCVRPSPPENVALAVEHFIGASANSVVLLDGLEYLIAHNDFLSVLALIQDLNETVSVQNSILLLPVDPRALGDREYALIRREVEMIPIPPAGAQRMKVELKLRGGGKP